MKIGLFTDTYFPQVSGVATSIKTLTEALETAGHEVYIFTTTDPKAVVEEEPEHLVRLSSIPFVSLAERQIVIKGVVAAAQIARSYELEVIHTQTEFGMGLLGKMVAKQLKIPVVHTMHTKYEDYVHYIAKGRLIRPGMVKYIIRNFLHGVDGVICPSEMVLETINRYGIDLPKQVIPTGIDLKRFDRADVTPEAVQKIRQDLGIAPDEIMLLSLSRISFEKNIHSIIKVMPQVLAKRQVKFVIVGRGPYEAALKKQVQDLGLEDCVIFAGLVDSDDTVFYYRAADFFISASTSETQGLTFTESLASHTPIIAQRNPYLANVVDQPAFGYLYEAEADLATSILRAIDQTPDMEEDMLAAKLYDISAEKFAKTVYAFYLDAKITLAHHYEELRPSLSKRVARSAITTPQRVIKTTLTVPQKMVKTMQKYGRIIMNRK